SAAGAEAPEMEADKVLPAGLGMQGAANLGGLKFGKVTLGKMNFKLALKKQVFTESGAIAGYQGNIQENVRLDFTQKLLGYGVNAELKNVDVQPLLNDVVDTFVAAKLKKPEIISEIKDKLTGHLSGKLQINGAGVSSQVAKPRLTGSGTFNLQDGRLRKFAFQDQLAGLFGSDKFRQDIPFDNTAINFTLAQQVVDLTKFDMSSGAQGEGGDIRLWAQGKIKFTADFENFHLRPSLNPRAASNLSSQFRQYAEVLKDDRGWLTIPVVMNGAVKSPTVVPDWDWIKKQFAGYAGKKLGFAANAAGQKLQGFVNSQQGKAPEQIQQNAAQELEKAKEQLKNLDGLKNLFK
ncbi:MAG: AsmA-like C-terminal region-containing protein, partial [Candidatus Firestonebacteria bacterium]|nr:AsmA-like C-terminal region-containing protein [Candidatus Firestonebacteria bacterium]